MVALLDELILKLFVFLVGRVADTDGEFLLVEAAHHLPNWTNPDTAQQRVSRVGTLVNSRGMRVARVSVHAGDICGLT